MNDEKGEIYVLDLFSGIGGFALAAEIANAMADSGNIRFHPIAHAEVEPFACAVYHRHFPDSVCFGGVQNVTRDALLERCGILPDVVCGGFPCQPHSTAGKRLASADERDLWGECRRILRDVRPRFALFENVGGLLTSESGLFYNRVLSDLAEIRYACQWQVVPASAVGAPHRRDRVWMLCWDELADSNKAGLQWREDAGSIGGGWTNGNEHARGHDTGLLWPAIDGNWPSRPGEAQHGWEPPRVVAYTKGQRGGRDSGSVQHEDGRSVDGLPRQSDEPGEGVVGKSTQQLLDGCGPVAGEAGSAEFADSGKRQALTSLGSSFDGLPSTVGGDWPEVHNCVAQLKAAGNAIVPEVAAIFLHAILQVYQTEDLA